MIGLVLTAGGARGAYQAGVLKRIGELPRLKNAPSPFAIIAGASAGAINGAYLAAECENFQEATLRMAALWANLKVKNVFKTDALSLGLRSAGWLQDLSLGGIWGGGIAQSLLDFSPLRSHLLQNIPFEKIGPAIQKNLLYAVAVSATNYYSGKSYTFIHGQPNHPLWEKSRRISLSVPLTVDHIWASCAIPIVFQPVLVSTKAGDYYFGDGGLRLTTPCSPAIRLGASKVFAIGIRSQKAAEARSQIELLDTNQLKITMRRPPLAQIFGVALNSIFLDHLDTDLEHLDRMNDLLQSAPEGTNTKKHIREPMRIISPLAVHPSVDLASIAEVHKKKMPHLVRYLMEGLGASKAQSADLMSYLLFDSSYTQALLEIGYQDATQNLSAIESFLFSNQ